MSPTLAIGRGEKLVHILIKIWKSPRFATIAEVVSVEHRLDAAPMTEEPEHHLKRTRNGRYRTYLHKKLAFTQVKHKVVKTHH